MRRYKLSLYKISILLFDLKGHDGGAPRKAGGKLLEDGERAIRLKFLQRIADRNDLRSVRQLTETFDQTSDLRFIETSAVEINDRDPLEVCLKEIFLPEFDTLDVKPRFHFLGPLNESGT